MAKQVTPGEYQGPAPDPAEGDEHVDPNRFRDFFKIDPSDESPSKQKRQLSKEEEEGKDVPPPDAAQPTDAFRAFMSGKSDDPSMFDIKAPQSVHSILPEKAAPVQTKQVRQPLFSQEELMATPESEPASPNLFIPQTQTPPPPAPPSQSLPSDQINRSEANIRPSENSSTTQPNSSSDNNTQSSSTQSDETQPAKTQTSNVPLPGRAKRKKSRVVTHPPAPVLPKPQSVEKSLTTNVSKVIKEVVHETPLPKDALKELVESEGPPKKAFPPHDIPGKARGMESYFAEMAKEKKNPSSDQIKAESAAGTPSAVGLPVAESSGDHDHEKKKGDDDHFVAEVGPLSSAQMVASSPENAPPSALPSYMRLSPQVFELFDRMVDVISVQHDRNVSTTTVTLSMKNSIFNGAKIQIDRYSTAPHSFNVQLQGSPEAQKYFAANLGSLAEAFKTSRLPYEINLLPPILFDEEVPGHEKEKKKYKRVERKEGA